MKKANSPTNLNSKLKVLKNTLQGELFFDKAMRSIYATDASIYRELPLAVALPKNEEDLKLLIAFAHQHNTSLIPRAAGTSLAGQCVGNGIVVDISKYFNKILEFNKTEKWVRVQPGVVRDELNAYLKPHGLFFSPITSTANRAMIGGMVGNNSCGTTSITYGSTREHTSKIKALLSDGSEVTFEELSEEEFTRKCALQNLEGELYRQISSELNNKDIQEAIITEFPKESIHRRNTGYAVDYLLKSNIFSNDKKTFNFCKLICGSEGTLAFATEITLDLDDLPKPFEVVLAPHFESIHDSMKATQYAMKHSPTACELMDKIILDCTKENASQNRNRAFVVGDPKAILLIEFRGDTLKEAEQKANNLTEDLVSKELGYAFPLLHPPITSGVWSLRSAGLGLLSNLPGDAKGVACIEDTAVALDDLADYIDEFTEMMEEFGQEAVYYAHAGAGEIHLRPILNLKEAADRKALYDISKASALLVKKYNGSLSGEHGDGRLRASFIPLMVGPKNYKLFQRIKSTWDPKGIFNPGKIVNAPEMNEDLRYEEDQQTDTITTVFNFDSDGGILRHAEKCNGSGDCRKLPVSGGTMCPSYMATRNEKDTTRARANILREFLTHSDKKNRFDHEEIMEIMDLCISCKGCSSECPSNVDMSSLKAEFLYQYYQSNRIPLRSVAFANIDRLNKLGSIWPGFYNFLLSNKISSGLMKSILGIAQERSLPVIGKTSLHNWYHRYRATHQPPKNPIKTVYLFNDEFTNWHDCSVGISAVILLETLGYQVIMVEHYESGRAALSKGLLRKAKKMANKNVRVFKELINDDVPLIGIEPSAILSFRDEYPRLVDKTHLADALKLKEQAFLIEEFIANEIKSGHITSSSFTLMEKHIKLHGHCHQKALSNIEDAVSMLSLPQNYHIEVIPSGCCGMAGSFGYEAEHYNVSQQIGELVLFPAIRKSKATDVIAASGTSCRHQILDGTGRYAQHPIKILHDALI
jgi:FAD/FMN-containing dehydrogenase/Fe-S oxidoreductase